MVVLDRVLLSAAEFEQVALQPENRDLRLEWIDGEIRQLVVNDQSSAIAMYVGGLMAVFVRQHDLGYVTGADGGYVIGEHRYIPDAAFMSKTRQTAPSGQAYNPTPPTLALEVLSPTDRHDEVESTIAHYLAAGTRVWSFDPQTKTVQVHRVGLDVLTLTLDDTLDGEDMLPGFQVPLRDIFR